MTKLDQTKAILQLELLLIHFIELDSKILILWIYDNDEDQVGDYRTAAGDNNNGDDNNDQ